MVKNNNDDDDKYNQIERFLLHVKTPTIASSGVINNLIHPSIISSQENTDASLDNPSSTEKCMSNPCENGGICISTGQMTYECKCVGPWRGIHCSNGLKKRSLTKRQSLYQLMQEMKRNKNKQDENDGGRPYYDFRNGIYF
ncbi:unnamed protein product [Adineta steineri]|uniref:EGF-like domain-containing protein n=1 Tax=Adineta steineri TaxID=433720 RepID=A0A818X0F0_9BILA|nr:unnamed protein product [Adineta steineri]CAF3733153.1 unnamed protein product [Adineta steineri]